MLAFGVQPEPSFCAAEEAFGGPVRRGQMNRSLTGWGRHVRAAAGSVWILAATTRADGIGDRQTCLR
jgi:hypothetical protein